MPSLAPVMYRPLLLLALSLFVSTPPAPPGNVAVVVHPTVPVETISMADLRKLLLGDQQFWTPNLRVTLLMGAPAAREREVMLQKVYRMTEAQFRRYWIAKVFRADVPAGPKLVSSNQAALELVATIPGAIAFIDVAEVRKGLKVLKIEGRLPGEEGYPLQ